MTRFHDLVTKAAREMRSYVASPASASQTDPLPEPAYSRTLIRLDSNENPFGPSPRAIEAIRSTAQNVHTYPDDNCDSLRARLAAHHNLSIEQVLVTPGSTGMLALLCETLLVPGLNAVTSECSFVIYSMLVQATGADLIQTPMKNDGFDLEAIDTAINENTRLVFIANPNNPTGTIVDADAVSNFLEKIPDHIVVVLDEAYHEFAEGFAAARNSTYSRSLERLRKGANIVVLRTFSKAHGLAGLRVGYGLGPPELMSYCTRMRETFSVSSMAESAAIAALDDHGHISRTVDNNTTQSQVVRDELTALGFHVAPTWANFVYYDVGKDAAQFAGQLLHEGVSVRPLASWGAPKCIRVSIGTKEENQIFLNAVRKISRQ